MLDLSLGVGNRCTNIWKNMPQTPHVEKHFTATGTSAKHILTDPGCGGCIEERSTQKNKLDGAMTWQSGLKKSATKGMCTLPLTTI
jgi:hypothetical protein